MIDPETSGAPLDWQSANQRYLGAALAEVRRALAVHAGEEAGPAAEAVEWPDGLADPALLSLAKTFDLSPFERSILLLAVGVELDGAFAALCGRAQGDPQRGYPTFGLALAALPDPEWEAIAPESPLRRWRLLEVGAGPAMTASPLRVDERILHFVVGVEQRDERLAGLVESVSPAGELVPSHADLAGRIAAAWSRTVGSADFPVVQVCGAERAGKRAVAAAAAARLGLSLVRLPAEALPSAPAELENLARIWQREAILTGSVLLVEADELDAADAAREATLHRFLEGVPGALLLSVRERRRPRERPLLAYDVGKPSAAEQRAVWRAVVGDSAERLAERIDGLVAQFDLSAPTIHAAWAGALGRLDASGTSAADPQALGEALWATCRVQARPGLADLAERIEPASGWDDLIVPEPQRDALHQISAHLRHRARVLDAWGFAGHGRRGLGTSALFAGASGTGKTLAAEVLAGELGLDLYRIDLSAVVSKYIGETEKNLRRVFDAAEEGGAVLLFDEADALFGKRSEVKDSHDRYANIEVSYLLQRMESYHGLAVLTTNLKDALDQAFLRRLRFVVDFPFPNAVQREAIWRRVFPQATPTARLDFAKLARLNVAGGSIRNIALNAAYLAAEAGEPVAMRHLLEAARAEYGKHDKTLTEVETRGWV